MHELSSSFFAHFAAALVPQSTMWKCPNCSCVHDVSSWPGIVMMSIAENFFYVHQLNSSKVSVSFASKWLEITKKWLWKRGVTFSVNVYAFVVVDLNRRTSKAWFYQLTYHEVIHRNSDIRNTQEGCDSNAHFAKISLKDERGRLLNRGKLGTINRGDKRWIIKPEKYFL